MASGWPCPNLLHDSSRAISEECYLRYRSRLLQWFDFWEEHSSSTRPVPTFSKPLLFQIHGPACLCNELGSAFPCLCSRETLVCKIGNVGSDASLASSSSSKFFARFLRLHLETLSIVAIWRNPIAHFQFSRFCEWSKDGSFEILQIVDELLLIPYTCTFNSRGLHIIEMLSTLSSKFKFDPTDLEELRMMFSDPYSMFRLGAVSQGIKFYLGLVEHVVLQLMTVVIGRQWFKFIKSSSFADYALLEYRATVNCTLPVSPQSFTWIRRIGRGGFGEIYTARKNDTGHIYAIKVLSKEKIKKAGVFNLAINERNFLGYISSPFVTGLRYAFQNDRELYLVLDMKDGGDLDYILCKYGPLCEELVRFYAAQVLLGILSIHTAGIAHRDLKPANILISLNGNACITDLGLACRVSNSFLNAHEGSWSSKPSAGESSTHKFTPAPPEFDAHTPVAPTASIEYHMMNFFLNNKRLPESSKSESKAFGFLSSIPPLLGSDPPSAEFLAQTNRRLASKGLSCAPYTCRSPICVPTCKEPCSHSCAHGCIRQLRAIDASSTLAEVEENRLRAAECLEATLDAIGPLNVDLAVFQGSCDPSESANVEPAPSGAQAPPAFVGGKAGTPGFWAPEMLRKDGSRKPAPYDGAVDYWSYGCLIYTMLTGMGPFSLDRNACSNEENIATLTRDPHFPPSHIGPEAEDLIRRLLDRNPFTRLGCGPLGALEIMKHPFFKGIDWGALECGKIPALWHPPTNLLEIKQMEQEQAQYERAVAKAMQQHIELYGSAHGFVPPKREPIPTAPPGVLAAEAEAESGNSSGSKSVFTKAEQANFAGWDYVSTSTVYTEFLNNLNLTEVTKRSSAAQIEMPEAIRRNPIGYLSCSDGILSLATPVLRRLQQSESLRKAVSKVLDRPTLPLENLRAMVTSKLRDLGLPVPSVETVVDMVDNQRSEPVSKGLSPIVRALILGADGQNSESKEVGNLNAPWLSFFPNTQMFRATEAENHEGTAHETKGVLEHSKERSISHVPQGVYTINTSHKSNSVINKSTSAAVGGEGGSISPTRPIAPQSVLKEDHSQSIGRLSAMIATATASSIALENERKAEESRRLRSQNTVSTDPIESSSSTSRHNSSQATVSNSISSCQPQRSRGKHNKSATSRADSNTAEETHHLNPSNSFVGGRHLREAKSSMVSPYLSKSNNPTSATSEVVTNNLATEASLLHLAMRDNSGTKSASSSDGRGILNPSSNQENEDMDVESEQEDLNAHVNGRYLMETGKMLREDGEVNTQNIVSGPPSSLAEKNDSDPAGSIFLSSTPRAPPANLAAASNSLNNVASDLSNQIDHSFSVDIPFTSTPFQSPSRPHTHINQDYVSSAGILPESTLLETINPATSDSHKKSNNFSACSSVANPQAVSMVTRNNILGENNISYSSDISLPSTVAPSINSAPVSSVRSASLSNSVGTGGMDVEQTSTIRPESTFIDPISLQVRGDPSRSNQVIASHLNNLKSEGGSDSIIEVDATKGHRSSHLSIIRPSTPGHHSSIPLDRHPQDLKNLENNVSPNVLPHLVPVNNSVDFPHVVVGEENEQQRKKSGMMQSTISSSLPESYPNRSFTTNVTPSLAIPATVTSKSGQALPAEDSKNSGVDGFRYQTSADLSISIPPILQRFGSEGSQVVSPQLTPGGLTAGRDRTVSLVLSSQLLHTHIHSDASPDVCFTLREGNQGSSSDSGMSDCAIDPSKAPSHQVEILHLDNIAKEAILEKPAQAVPFVSDSESDQQMDDDYGAYSRKDSTPMHSPQFHRKSGAYLSRSTITVQTSLSSNPALPLPNASGSPVGSSFSHSVTHGRGYSYSQSPRSSQTQYGPRIDSLRNNGGHHSIHENESPSDGLPFRTPHSSPGSGAVPACSPGVTASMSTYPMNCLAIGSSMPETPQTMTPLPGFGPASRVSSSLYSVGYANTPNGSFPSLSPLGRSQSGPLQSPTQIRSDHRPIIGTLEPRRSPPELVTSVPSPVPLMDAFNRPSSTHAANGILQNLPLSATVGHNHDTVDLTGAAPVTPVSSTHDKNFRFTNEETKVLGSTQSGTSFVSKTILAVPIPISPSSSTGGHPGTHSTEEMSPGVGRNLGLGFKLGSSGSGFVGNNSSGYEAATPHKFMPSYDNHSPNQNHFNHNHHHHQQHPISSKGSGFHPVSTSSHYARLYSSSHYAGQPSIATSADHTDSGIAPDHGFRDTMNCSVSDSTEAFHGTGSSNPSPRYSRRQPGSAPSSKRRTMHQFHRSTYRKGNRPSVSPAIHSVIVESQSRSAESEMGSGSVHGAGSPEGLLPDYDELGHLLASANATGARSIRTSLEGQRNNSPLKKPPTPLNSSDLNGLGTSSSLGRGASPYGSAGTTSRGSRSRGRWKSAAGDNSEFGGSESERENAESTVPFQSQSYIPASVNLSLSAFGSKSITPPKDIDLNAVDAECFDAQVLGRSRSESRSASRHSPLNSRRTLSRHSRNFSASPLNQPALSSLSAAPPLGSRVSPPLPSSSLRTSPSNDLVAHQASEISTTSQVRASDSIFLNSNHSIITKSGPNGTTRNFSSFKRGVVLVECPNRLQESHSCSASCCGNQITDYSEGTSSVNVSLREIEDYTSFSGSDGTEAFGGLSQFGQLTPGQMSHLSTPDRNAVGAMQGIGVGKFRNRYGRAVLRAMDDSGLMQGFSRSSFIQNHNTSLSVSTMSPSATMNITTECSGSSSSDDSMNSSLPLSNPWNVETKPTVQDVGPLYETKTPIPFDRSASERVLTADSSKSKGDAPLLRAISMDSGLSAISAVPPVMYCAPEDANSNYSKISGVSMSASDKLGSITQVAVNMRVTRSVSNMIERSKLFAVPQRHSGEATIAANELSLMDQKSSVHLNPAPINLFRRQQANGSTPFSTPPRQVSSAHHNASPGNHSVGNGFFVVPGGFSSSIHSPSTTLSPASTRRPRSATPSSDSSIGYSDTTHNSSSVSRTSCFHAVNRSSVDSSSVGGQSSPRFFRHSYHTRSRGASFRACSCLPRPVAAPNSNLCSSCGLPMIVLQDQLDDLTHHLPPSMHSSVSTSNANSGLNSPSQSHSESESQHKGRRRPTGKRAKSDAISPPASSRNSSFFPSGSVAPHTMPVKAASDATAVPISTNGTPNRLVHPTLTDDDGFSDDVNSFASDKNLRREMQPSQSNSQRPSPYPEVPSIEIVRVIQDDEILANSSGVNPSNTVTQTNPMTVTLPSSHYGSSSCDHHSCSSTSTSTSANKNSGYYSGATVSSSAAVIPADTGYPQLNNNKVPYDFTYPSMYELSSYGSNRQKLPSLMSFAAAIVVNSAQKGARRPPSQTTQQGYRGPESFGKLPSGGIQAPENLKPSGFNSNHPFSDEQQDIGPVDRGIPAAIGSSTRADAQLPEPVTVSYIHGPPASRAPLLNEKPGSLSSTSVESNLNLAGGSDFSSSCPGNSPLLQSFCGVDYESRSEEETDNSSIRSSNSGRVASNVINPQVRELDSNNEKSTSFLVKLNADARLSGLGFAPFGLPEMEALSRQDIPTKTVSRATMAAITEIPASPCFVPGQSPHITGNTVPIQAVRAIPLESRNSVVETLASRTNVRRISTASPGLSAASTAPSTTHNSPSLHALSTEPRMVCLTDQSGRGSIIPDANSGGNSSSSGVIVSPFNFPIPTLTEQFKQSIYLSFLGGPVALGHSRNTLQGGTNSVSPTRINSNLSSIPSQTATDGMRDIDVVAATTSAQSPASVIGIKKVTIAAPSNAMYEVGDANDFSAPFSPPLPSEPPQPGQYSMGPTVGFPPLSSNSTLSIRSSLNQSFALGPSVHQHADSNSFPEEIRSTGAADTTLQYPKDGRASVRTLRLASSTAEQEMLVSAENLQTPTASTILKGQYYNRSTASGCNSPSPPPPLAMSSFQASRSDSPHVKNHGSEELRSMQSKQAPPSNPHGLRILTSKQAVHPFGNDTVSSELSQLNTVGGIASQSSRSRSKSFYISGSGTPSPLPLTLNATVGRSSNPSGNHSPQHHNLTAGGTPSSPSPRSMGMLAPVPPATLVPRPIALNPPTHPQFHTNNSSQLDARNQPLPLSPRVIAPPVIGSAGVMEEDYVREEVHDLAPVPNRSRDSDALSSVFTFPSNSHGTQILTQSQDGTKLPPSTMDAGLNPHSYSVLMGEPNHARIISQAPSPTDSMSEDSEMNGKATVNFVASMKFGAVRHNSVHSLNGADSKVANENLSVRNGSLGDLHASEDSVSSNDDTMGGRNQSSNDGNNNLIVNYFLHQDNPTGQYLNPFSTIDQSSFLLLDSMCTPNSDDTLPQDKTIPLVDTSLGPGQNFQEKEKGPERTTTDTLGTTADEAHSNRKKNSMAGSTTHIPTSIITRSPVARTVETSPIPARPVNSQPVHESLLLSNDSRLLSEVSLSRWNTSLGHLPRTHALDHSIEAERDRFGASLMTHTTPSPLSSYQQFSLSSDQVRLMALKLTPNITDTQPESLCNLDNDYFNPRSPRRHARNDFTNSTSSDNSLSPESDRLLRIEAARSAHESKLKQFLDTFSEEELNAFLFSNQSFEPSLFVKNPRNNTKDNDAYVSNTFIRKANEVNRSDVNEDARSHSQPVQDLSPSNQVYRPLRAEAVIARSTRTQDASLRCSPIRGHYQCNGSMECNGGADPHILSQPPTSFPSLAHFASASLAKAIKQYNSGMESDQSI